MITTIKHKISVAFAGYLLIGAASGLFIYCGLGADCFNSMVKGIAPYLHLSVGTSSYVIQLTMLAIVLMLGGRKQAGPGTVLGSLSTSKMLLLVCIGEIRVNGKRQIAAAWLDRRAGFVVSNMMQYRF